MAFCKAVISENPHKIFSYLNKVDMSAKFQVLCLMKKEKYNSFPDTDKTALESTTKENYLLEDIKIKNPNNPASLLECKLITFKVN